MADARGPHFRANPDLLVERAAPAFDLAAIEVGCSGDQSDAQSIDRAMPEPRLRPQIARCTDRQDSAEQFRKRKSNRARYASPARETGNIRAIWVERYLSAYVVQAIENDAAT